MAWLPSHQELRSHPKTRKAARRAGVSLPTMIGHLHLLWYWALDFAPDGDVARFDDDDLADAAEWDDDPARLIDALINCGSGGANGFITADRKLHDWKQYGGKYGKRVASAKKAAAARWDAAPEPSDSDGNADAMRTHSAGNAEERRGEKNNPSSPAAPSDDRFDLFWEQYPRGQAGKPGGDGSKKKAHAAWKRMSMADRDKALATVGNYASYLRQPDTPNTAHASTWLNQERWEQWETPARPQSRDGPAPRRPAVVGSDDWDRQRAEQEALERRLLGDTA